jgi:uncharacterized protein
MAKKRTPALEAINRFIAKVAQVIHIEKVILYGSTAKGTTHEWSDIDLAVVSNDFIGMSHKDRLTVLKKAAWDAKATEIDALGYTAQEFCVEDPLDLVYEIKKYGQIVFEAH